MKPTKFFIAIALVLVTLASCQIATNTAVPAGKTGTVNFVFPRIAPWVEAAGKSLNGAGQKAFVFVDAVEVDFFNGEELVKAVMLGQANYDETLNAITGSVRVPAGTYTRMIVSVFNTAVSNTVPVVAGQTESESVVVPVDGSVNVDLTMYPYAPVLLEEDVYSSAVTLNDKGETWYSFYATDSKTKVSVKSLAGDMDVYIFNPSGSVINDITGTGAEESVIFDTPVTDAPYYIAMVARAAGSEGQVKFGTGISYGDVNVIIH